MGRRRKNSAASFMSSTATSLVSSAVSSRMPSRAPSRAPSPARKGVFHFWRLPAELRLRIYEMALTTGQPLDLDPQNYRLVHPRMALFLVCRRMYEEAYPVFYRQPMRLFPYNGRFFHSTPLLARLPVRYQSIVSTLELRLGPGWSQPPRCQSVHSSLGLRNCTSLKTLKIFIEIDPSDNVFHGFRGKNATESTYENFCMSLLIGIIAQVPSLEIIEIDAFPGVKKDAPLVITLRRVVEEAGKTLIWGPLRGWEKNQDEPGLIGLEAALANLGISNGHDRAHMQVEVQA